MTYPNPLPAPQVFAQPEDSLLCWSAAYESWREAQAELHGNIVDVDQQALHRALEHYMTDAGGLTGPGMRRLMAIGHMEMFGFTCETLAAQALQYLLTQRGYLYFVYYWPANDGTDNSKSHAVVVYQVAGELLGVMDPVGGRGLIRRSISYLTSQHYHTFLVGAQRPT